MAIIILQHPDEVKQALGTARLVQSGLLRARVLTGLSFELALVFQCLSEFHAEKPLLLYPRALRQNTAHFVLDFETEHFTDLPLIKHYDSLILLDGTWRNTRELLHVNPWLGTLPTLGLNGAGQSRYQIRQAKRTGALATIEAVSKVLTVVDEVHQEQQFLLPFKKMIERQIALMGPAVFQKNYPPKSKLK